MVENKVSGDASPLIELPEFSIEVAEQSYCYEGEDVDGVMRRVSEHIASVEGEKERWTNRFYDEIASLRFVPAGRILSNAGIGVEGTGMVNCFADGFWGEGQDSISGISDALFRQAKILKSEGGYGFCADVLRPRGSYIRGIGGESIGAVGMLDLWQSQSNVFTRGNEKQSGKRKRGKKKIRNGAQMVTLSVWHPDIVEFIDAKQKSGSLTRMNMSVLIYDRFVNAVKGDEEWEFLFPDTESREYDEKWDGDLYKWKDAGLPVISYGSVRARWLWNHLTDASYNRNEPAVLFIDRINDANNLRSIEHISTTNPCGEQPLPKGGACVLGSMNVASFVKEDRTFDYDTFSASVAVATRFMDNVVSLTFVPLEEQRIEMNEKRRVGIGMLGLASAMMMLGIRYGSEESVEFASKVAEALTFSAYEASALLAREKGAFPAYKRHRSVRDAYQSGDGFAAVLPQYVKDAIMRYGLRNSHLVSMQPTGNTSIFAGIVSGGIEPVFSPEYVRTSRVPSVVEGLGLPSESPELWVPIREGDDLLHKRLFNGKTYKYSDDRGLLVETLVQDYAVRWLKERSLYSGDDTSIVSAGELSVAQHMSVMEAVARYVDSAVSKTVNLRADYPFEDYKDIYMRAYNSGVIKGITTYRAGTMATVLSEKPSDYDTSAVAMAVMATENERFVGVVGIREDKSISDLFMVRSANGIADDTIVAGSIKRGESSYDFVSDEVNILNMRSGDVSGMNENAVVRLVSSMLRNKIPVADILSQLSDGVVQSSMVRGINKVLKSFDDAGNVCPECGGHTVKVEGCEKCIDCGWSACKL